MSTPETDHAIRARRLLHYAENVSGDSLDAAQEGTLNALAGIGHALLAVADAIREQTKDLTTPLETPERDW